MGSFFCLKAFEYTVADIDAMSFGRRSPSPERVRSDYHLSSTLDVLDDGLIYTLVSRGDEKPSRAFRMDAASHSLLGSGMLS